MDITELFPVKDYISISKVPWLTNILNWEIAGEKNIKGALMQIWKFLYMFEFI